MTSTSAGTTEVPAPPKMTWLSGGAAIVDVNGDGTLDVVGRINLSTANQSDTKLAAFDGASGVPLWMSDELKLASDTTPGALVISEDTVVFAEDETSLRAFSLGDGVARWTSPLPEKLSQVCVGSKEGSIAMQTADLQWHSVALADGGIEVLSWEGPCRSLEGDSAYLSPAGQLHLDAPFDYGSLVLGNAEGMLAQKGVFDLGSKIAIGFAIKKPGSEVPMLARYEHQQIDARIVQGDLEAMRIDTAPASRDALIRKLDAIAKKVKRSEAKVLWAVAVPSADPLKAKEGVPQHRNVALQDDVVVIAYEDEHGALALTAFDVADGTRLWEIALSGTEYVSRIRASPEHVLVVRRSGISVFGLRDGHVAYSIAAN